MEAGHLPAVPINEEELLNSILSQIMRKAEQRDWRKTRLRGHNVELKVLNLIILAVGAVRQFKHDHWKHDPDEYKGRPA